MSFLTFLLSDGLPGEEGNTGLVMTTGRHHTLRARQLAKLKSLIVKRSDDASAYMHGSTVGKWL